MDCLFWPQTTTPYVFQLADFGYSDANDLVGAQASRLPAYVVGASAPYNLGVPLAGAADGTSAIQWDNFTAVTIGSLPLEAEGEEVGRVDDETLTKRVGNGISYLSR